MLTYGKLDGLTEYTLEDINRLLTQLSRNAAPLTRQALSEMLEQPSFHLLVCQNESGAIVGMASIYFIQIPTGMKGYIDDVVVRDDYRGQGIGRELTKKLLELALCRGAKYVDLTSGRSSEREVANAMYVKLGFELRDTNPYRKRLQ